MTHSHAFLGLIRSLRKAADRTAAPSSGGVKDRQKYYLKRRGPGSKFAKGIFSSQFCLN